MELQVPYRICAKISAKSLFRREANGDQRNIEEVMPVERSRNYRGRSMPGSYTYAGEHPAENERFGIYGIFEGEECVAHISEMGEYEVCIPKPRILVQGILRRYRGEEHESDKRVHSATIGK